MIDDKKKVERPASRHRIGRQVGRSGQLDDVHGGELFDGAAGGSRQNHNRNCTDHHQHSHLPTQGGRGLRFDGLVGAVRADAALHRTGPEPGCLDLLARRTACGYRPVAHLASQLLRLLAHRPGVLPKHTRFGPEGPPGFGGHLDGGTGIPDRILAGPPIGDPQTWSAGTRRGGAGSQASNLYAFGSNPHAPAVNIRG